MRLCHRVGLLGRDRQTALKASSTGTCRKAHEAGDTSVSSGVTPMACSIWHMSQPDIFSGTHSGAVGKLMCAVGVEGGDGLPEPPWRWTIEMTYAPNYQAIPVPGGGLAR